MKIFVTGLPRCRSTEVVNLCSEYFNITKPKNKWGELQLLKDQADEFLKKNNFVTKIWPLHFTNICNLLEQSADIIIFCNTDNHILWRCKMVNALAHGEEWPLDPCRQIRKISLADNLQHINDLKIYEKKFKEFHHSFYQNFNLVKKTVFVVDGKVFSHFDNNCNQNFIQILQEKMSVQIERQIKNYVIENENTVENYFE